MKIWLLAFGFAFFVPAGGAVAEGTDPKDSHEDAQLAGPAEPAGAWMDSSHDYATSQAQALSEWMDSFFGVPNYEVELPESLLRIDFTSDWDEEDGTNYNARLRGKLQLPGLSRRLNLVFSDESGDELDIDTNNNDDRNLDSGVGFLYEVSDSKRSRLDLTMGINWNRLRPGIRYRYQGTLGDFSNYRLTQRLQYETDEGFYSTSQVELNRALSQNTILRWNNRGVYGEETDGVEWLTRLSLFQRHKRADRRRDLGINYFAAINGVSDPDYVKNYRVGALFRRQVYRKYLFLELEPAYNYRKKKPHQNRQFIWSIAVRLEIALERDLARRGGRSESPPAGSQEQPAQATRLSQQPAADSTPATEHL